MLIYYKDFAYERNTDNVEIIFNDVNMSFNNNENSVKIMNSSFYDETYNYSTFYNKDKFITENEIRFAPGFSGND